LLFYVHVNYINKWAPSTCFGLCRSSWDYCKTYRVFGSLLYLHDHWWRWDRCTGFCCFFDGCFLSCVFCLFLFDYCLKIRFFWWWFACRLRDGFAYWSYMLGNFFLVVICFLLWCVTSIVFSVLPYLWSVASMCWA